MVYKQFRPHPALTPYIDAYWIVRGNQPIPRSYKILPDGCVDIIFNLGNDIPSGSGEIGMKSERAYLVGTMIRYKESVIVEHTYLAGIRFKPAGFSAFYKFASLHEFTDQTIECDNILLPDLKQVQQHAVSYLNQFFLNRLTRPKHTLFPVLQSIESCKGQIKVDELAKAHFVTVRQLERSFRQHIGASPKEFIRLVRYQHTLEVLKKKKTDCSLSDIAFDCGYYDQAHLTNEFKYYTGVTPTQL
jgi:AraC-like DNA-binding protein